MQIVDKTVLYSSHFKVQGSLEKSQKFAVSNIKRRRCSGMATTQKKAPQAIKVFISSTYQDLVPYRQKVNEAIQRLQQVVVGMEWFGADADTPVDTCIERVQESSIFVIIIGFRYGSIANGFDKSITQIEYETAIAANIPTLVYIIDDSQPVSLQYVDFENRNRLNDFKKRLKSNHVISTFTTPDDLGLKVLADLQRELNKTETSKTINIEQDDIPSGEDAVEIFRKFILRPIRYDRQEINLPVTISSGFSGWRLNKQIISALGLTIGDTISCDINAKSISQSGRRQNVLSESLNRFSIYAEGINADWLESVVTHINQTITMRLRLRATMVKGLIEGKRDEETLYVCAIVVGNSSKTNKA